jgi:hypothetical protein
MTDETAVRGVPAKPQDEKAHWAWHAVPYEVHQHHRTGSSAPPLEASPPGDTERVFGDPRGAGLKIGVTARNERWSTPSAQIPAVRARSDALIHQTRSSARTVVLVPPDGVSG